MRLPKTVLKKGVWTDAAIIDPENSIFQNRKIRCRIIRFKSIFCEFLRIFPKNQIGKKLEMTWNIYSFHMTSCVNGFLFRYSGEAKTNTVELYRINL